MTKRHSIEVPGIGHKAPIPMGSKIGNIVFSSGISGHDPDTQTTPSDPGQQARVLMQNVRRFMTAAGGTPEDIIRLTLHVKDRKLRVHFDKEWLAMFPDEHSRPARHAVNAELGEQTFFQVEIVAVLQG
jgi:2-iminobutanoate/2-iminopropanoate deaminase